MLSQFQLNQLRAIRALPLFQHFVNVQGHLTWEHTADTGEDDIDSAGPIVVNAWMKDGTMLAQRIGRQRVLCSVLV